MNYAYLLQRSFKLAFRPYLWFFGLFAGGGASFNFNIPSFSPEDFDSPESYGYESSSFTGLFLNQSSEGLFLVLAAIFVLVMLVVLLFLALSSLSQGALIGSVAELEQGKQGSFVRAFTLGLHSFWAALRLYLVMAALSVVLIMLVGLPLAGIVFAVFSAGPPSTMGIIGVVIVGVLGLLMLLLAFIPLNIITQLAFRELVLGGTRRRVLAALKMAAGLFKQGFGSVLLVWLLSVVLGIVTGVAVLAIFLWVGFGLALPLILLFTLGFAWWKVGLVVFFTLLFLAAFFTLSGIAGTFHSSYWTLAYLQLKTRHLGALAAPGLEGRQTQWNTR